LRQVRKFLRSCKREFRKLLAVVDEEEWYLWVPECAKRSSITLSIGRQ